MSTRRERAERIRHLIETEGDAVYENATHFNEVRYASLDGFDRYEELREQTRAIKEDAIERLPHLIEQLRESVSANGGAALPRRGRRGRQRLYRVGLP